MIVQYAGLDFQLEHISRWDERAVYSDDGVDFLCNHVTLGLQAVWNPAATRSKDGNAGLLSFAALHQAMMTPQRQLKVTVGDTVVLEVPGKRPGGDRNFTVDVKNGPQPLGFQVLEVRGTKTAVIYWEVECWINLCPGGSSALLSHRWEVTHDISELFLTTRTVVGRAVFRSDFLRDYPNKPVRHPDDFRADLFCPVPKGMQRESVQVVPSSDDVSVQYRVVDREQWLSKGLTNPVVKIQGEWRSGIDGGDLTDPGTRYVACVIHVWGSPRARRQDMIDACIRALATWKLDNKGGLTSRRAYYRSDVSVNLVEKEAEVNVGFYTGSGLGRVANFLNPAFDEADRLLLNFPEDIQDLAKAEPGPNPRPPFGFGSRGSVAGRIVAQALLSRCGKPGRFPDPEDPKYYDA